MHPHYQGDAAWLAQGVPLSPHPLPSNSDNPGHGFGGPASETRFMQTPPGPKSICSTPTQGARCLASSWTLRPAPYLPDSVSPFLVPASSVASLALVGTFHEPTVGGIPLAAGWPCAPPSMCPWSTPTTISLHCLCHLTIAHE